MLSMSQKMIMIKNWWLRYMLTGVVSNCKSSWRAMCSCMSYTCWIRPLRLSTWIDMTGQCTVCCWEGAASMAGYFRLICPSMSNIRKFRCVHISSAARAFQHKKALFLLFSCFFLCCTYNLKKGGRVNHIPPPIKLSQRADITVYTYCVYIHTTKFQLFSTSP